MWSLIFYMATLILYLVWLILYPGGLNSILEVSRLVHKYYFYYVRVGNLFCLALYYTRYQITVKIKSFLSRDQLWFEWRNV